MFTNDCETLRTAELSGPTADVLGTLIGRQRDRENATGIRWGNDTRLLATPADAMAVANARQIKSAYIHSYGVGRDDQRKPITVEQANHTLRDHNLPLLGISDDATPGEIRWYGPGPSWHSDPATMDPAGDLERATGQPLRRIDGDESTWSHGRD